MINNLALYISSTTRINATLLTNITVSIERLDTLVKSVHGVNLTVKANTSFIMVQTPDRVNNFTGLGATFVRGSGGQVVYTLDKDNETNAGISAAAFIAKESFVNVTSVNIVIIDDPTQFTTVDDSSGSILDSSVIVVGTNGNPAKMNLTLYFRSWNGLATTNGGDYRCSFYNASRRTWDTSGCTIPFENRADNRYECSCDHLSAFALVWLPRSPGFCKNTTHSISLNDSCLPNAVNQVGHLMVLIRCSPQ